MAVCSKPASLVQILHSRVIDCVILDMEQTNCAICLILILLLLHECVVTLCFCFCFFFCCSNAVYVHCLFCRENYWKTAFIDYHGVLQ